MKVTRDMYGKAAKCVACHRKWFVPQENEIPADTTLIQLQDHPELLRKTGVFVRAAGVIDENEAGEVGAAVPAFLAEEEAQESPSANRPAADAKGPAESKPATVSPEEDLADGGVPPGTAEKPLDNVPAAIRAKGKTPFDTWEPLRLLCSYQKAFDQLEQRVLEDEEPEVTPEVLTAYANALGQVWKKLRATLQHGHDSAQRQLAGIEAEIDRLTVALRVGEVDLPHFISTVATLRQSRESLARLDYNLLAWREVEDPCIAGGELDLSLDSFDPDAFAFDPPSPTPLADAPPLPMLYSDALRAAMQARTGAEQRRAEWKRIAESRPDGDPSVTRGLADTSADLERVMARIAFLRQRMQHVLADCAHDLDSFHKFRRDVLERDRKHQLKRGIKGALLLDIDKAESDLVRIEAYLRQTLHANASTEVPEPTATLLERLQPQLRVPRKTIYTLGAYSAAVVLILPVLFLLSWRETGEIHRIILLPTLVLLAQPVALLFRNLWLRMVAAVFLWILLGAIVVAALFSFARYTPLRAGRPILPFLDSPGLLLVLGFFCCGLAVGIIVVEYHRLGLKKALPLLLCCVLISGAVPAATYAWAQREGGSVSYTPSTSYGEPQASIPASVNSNPSLKEPIPDTNTPQPFTETTMETPPDAEEPPVETSPDSTTVADKPVLAKEGEVSPVSDVSQAHAIPVMFSLIGVVHGKGISPLFRASLLFPDGTEESLNLSLGQTIIGDWTASEYNAEAKKLTITNGNKLLVLNPGEKVDIDATTSAQQEDP